jgi:hypothetical protein
MTAFQLNIESAFADQWAKFVERLSALNKRMIQELESCWRDMQSVLAKQLEELEIFATRNSIALASQ